MGFSCVCYKTDKNMIIDKQYFNDDVIINELMYGDGLVHIKQVFPQDVIADYRNTIQTESIDLYNSGVGNKRQRINFSRLIQLDEKIWHIVQSDYIDKVAKKWLGGGYHLGSMTSLTLMPGYITQEPHLDYPYLALRYKGRWSSMANTSFPLNLQAIVCLTEFTQENGGTLYYPGSQKKCQYPDTTFWDNCKQIISEPGDLVLYFGAMWHAGAANKTNVPRSAFFLQLLPRFITQLEDVKLSLPKEFYNNLSEYDKERLEPVTPKVVPPPCPLLDKGKTDYAVEYTGLQQFTK